MLISHEREKLADAVIFFARNTKYCGITKLFKLLYFLDFTHFRETGRSVTGLDYVTWPQGPAPESLWHEIKGDLQDYLKSSVRFEDVACEESLKNFTKIIPLRAFDGSHLTKREQRIMEVLADSVMRTARRAGASVPDGGDHEIVFPGNCGNQLRRGCYGKVLFFVIAHLA